MNMLNERQVTAFEQDGYLSGIRVMTEKEVQYFRDSFDVVEAKEGHENTQAWQANHATRL